MKTKRKYWKWIAIAAIAVVLISNFTVISYLGREAYSYRNYDNTFSLAEEDGGKSDFLTIKARYALFLKAHPEEATTDSALYRTFTIKPWRFWQWSDFLFCPERFKLPYKATP